MKSFRNFLRKIDIFGVPFNFKYKTKDKYSTPLGGFILLIIASLSLGFGIYYLLPFLNRKNLSIIYYTMNIPKTEQIRLKDSQAIFTVGLDCDDYTDLKAADVFKLETRYVIYLKNKEGTYDKNKTLLSSHNCTYYDFYNQYNDSFDYLALKTYQCLDDYNQKIEGIFSDQVFSYYEFSISAKSSTDKIEEYLRLNDCKLQMYFIDITIDLSNYKDPIDTFINAQFIQLDPTLFIKRNVYFMNQYLYDDDEIIAVFDEEQKPKQTKTLFSRYEEYALYLGLNREITKPLNTFDYAKIYVRADTKKTDIKRTYQKLTEFFADASSLLIFLYDFLVIIFSFINNFYAEQAIIKKLFIFKGMDNKHFNYNRRSEQINKLVTLSSGKRIIKNIKHKNYKIEFNDIHFNTNAENAKNENNDFSGKDLISTRSNGNKLKLKENKVNKKKKKSNTIFFNTNNENENNETSKRYLRNIRNVQNIKDNDMNNDINIQNTLIKEVIKNNEKNDNILKQKVNNYSFNFIEVMVCLLFPCCLKGKLKLKNYFNEKAINILYSKLNIILYVRNMILFDIINKTILDNKKKDIINFLSRPILSMNRDIFEEKDPFYEPYKEDDFDKFCEGMDELIKKPDKKDKEKRLVVISKLKLKELI